MPRDGLEFRSGDLIMGASPARNSRRDGDGGSTNPAKVADDTKKRSPARVLQRLGEWRDRIALCERGMMESIC